MGKSSGNLKNGFSSLHLLESIYRLLGGEEHLLRAVFDFEKQQWRFQGESFRKSISGCSHGEQILLRLAMDFRTQSSTVYLMEVLDTLDDINVQRLILAICHQKQIRKEVIHALVSDEDGSIRHL